MTNKELAALEAKLDVCMYDGKVAAQSGRPLSDNPHPLNESPHLAWTRGWAGARADYWRRFWERRGMMHRSMGEALP